MYAAQTPYLFEFTDGTQDLYRYIGSRSAPVDATLEVTGTLIKEDYTHSSADYFKTKNGEICGDNTVIEDSIYVSFSGDVKYTFTQAGTKSVREYKVDAKSSEEVKMAIEYDYGKVAKDDIVGTTEVMILRSYDKEMSEKEFRYVTEDNVKGGYRSVSDLKSAFAPTGEYTIVEAKDIWGDEDTPLPDYHYYGGDEEYCLFTDAQDDGLKTDSGMSSFLKSLPDCDVSDSYSDAKSIAGSASTSISADGSANGIDPLFLYIAIGVLALLVIVLAVLIISKKDASKE